MAYFKMRITVYALNPHLHLNFQSYIPRLIVAQRALSHALMQKKQVGLVTFNFFALKIGLYPFIQIETASLIIRRVRISSDPMWKSSILQNTVWWTIPSGDCKVDIHSAPSTGSACHLFVCLVSSPQVS